MSMRYGDWHIQYDPPPIPVRSMDWHYWHDDFDGAEDACDNRYGSVASLEAAMDEIDAYEAERFEDHGCAHGCRLGIEPGPFECMRTETCQHRDSDARTHGFPRADLLELARRKASGRYQHGERPEQLLPLREADAFAAQGIPAMTDPKLTRAAEMDLFAENERLRKALEKQATRFDHCSDMIAAGFNISGTLRAEHVLKARHFALEARDAAKQAAARAALGQEG